jgi:hypothetical protein
LGRAPSGYGTPEFGDQFRGKDERARRQGERLFDPTMLEHLATQVDEDPIDRSPADFDPDGMGSIAIDREKRRGLAATARAPAVDTDQLSLLKVTGNQANRVLGQARMAREVGLGCLTQPAQRRQDHALMELAQIG